MFNKLEDFDVVVGIGTRYNNGTENRDAHIQELVLYSSGKRLNSVIFFIAIYMVYVCVLCDISKLPVY